MMKIPEKVIDWRKTLSENIEKFTGLVDNKHINEIIQLANNEYLYWDKFKYLDMPEDVSPERAIVKCCGLSIL